MPLRKTKRNPSTPEFKIVNLEQGMPQANEALLRLDHELAVARAGSATLLKIIHGYGSTGVGGELRTAIQSSLREREATGKIRSFIPGEDWRVSQEKAWELLKLRPGLKHDVDLGRGNKGISIVLI